MIVKSAKHEGINQNSFGGPSVQFPNKGSSIYCKAIVTLITLFLLAAGLTVASLLLMSDEFDLRLKLEQEGTLVYQTEQSCSLNGVRRSHHLLSSTASVRIVNRTSSHFWFYLKLSFSIQRKTQMVNAADTELFLVRCQNGNPAKQTKATGRFEIYGNLNLAPEFIYNVENIVEQLFPEVQAKLYGMVFGRKKWRNIRYFVQPSIIPFPVSIHQEVERKEGNVILVNMFDDNDFVGTLVDEYNDWSDFWIVSYKERATVVENTGILKSSLVNLTVSLPYTIRRANKEESVFNKFIVKVSSKVFLLPKDKEVNKKWNIDKGPIWTKHFPRLKKKKDTRKGLNSVSPSPGKDNSTDSNSDYQRVVSGTINETELMYQSPTGGSVNSFGLFPFDLKELIRSPSNRYSGPLPRFVHLRKKITNTKPEHDTTNVQTEQLWSTLNDSDGEPDTEGEKDDGEGVEAGSQDEYDYNDPDSPPFDQDEEENDKLPHRLNPTMKRKLELENPSFPLPILPPLIPPILPSLTTLDEKTFDNRKKKRSIVTKTPSTIANPPHSINGKRMRSHRSLFSLSSNLKRSKRKFGTLSRENKSSFEAKRSISSDLDEVWDITSEGTTGPQTSSKSSVEVFRQKIFDVLVIGEIKNEIKSLIDDYEESTWQVVQTIYFNVGRFRFTVLKKKHEINKRLKNNLKEERTKHYFVPAGDLVSN